MMEAENERTWNGGSEAVAVLHEPLPQLVAADVGRADEHHGSLAVGPRVVQRHLPDKKEI